MNLLENGTSSEDLELDNNPVQKENDSEKYDEELAIEYTEEETHKQHAHKRKMNDNFLYKLVVLLLGVIVVLIVCVILLFTKQTKQTDTSLLQSDIIEYAEKQNSADEKEVQDQAVQADDTKSESPIIVEKSESNNSDNSIKDNEEEVQNNQLAKNAADYYEDLKKTYADEDESYTKEYILNEMIYHWEAGSTSAIYDLSALRRYRKLSYSLKGTNQYYYTGEQTSEGVPQGKGLAIYADNTYYYGDFVNGKREGEGYWFRFYYDSSLPQAKKGLITAHSYVGSWKNGLPDGEGTEHFDVNSDMLLDQGLIITNIIGHYNQGLYDGDIYCTTVEFPENVKEWDAVAENGVFSLWKDISVKGECSIWKCRSDEKLFMDIMKQDNKGCGLIELLK